MSDASDKVTVAKDALMACLGENGPKYLSHMKMWFCQKWTKEEFDIESRQLMSPEQMHLHNQFLLAILNKIDVFYKPPQSSPHSSQNIPGTLSGSTSRNDRRRKRSSRQFSGRAVFEPCDILDFMEEDDLEVIRPAAGTEANVQIMPAQRYCVQELFLPDAAFIMGRYLIGAWEAGLINVEDRVAEYVAMAVRVLLKNIISAIVMNRKHYKVTGDGTYYYDIGAQLRDPFLRNTVTRQKVDDSPLELDKEITSPNFMRRSNDDGTFLSACEELQPQQQKILITLSDLRLALSDRNLIPSHSTYSINMERITQMMR